MDGGGVSYSLVVEIALSVASSQGAWLDGCDCHRLPRGDMVNGIYSCRRRRCLRRCLRRRCRRRRYDCRLGHRYIRDTV